MSRKPKASAEPASETPQASSAVALQLAGQRLRAAHRRLKIAFADTYVELLEAREENTRISALLQESQRVIHTMSEQLPEDPSVT